MWVPVRCDVGGRARDVDFRVSVPLAARPSRDLVNARGQVMVAAWIRAGEQQEPRVPFSTSLIPIFYRRRSSLV
jgi:hypothetical protein